MSLVINKDKFSDIENAFTRLKANDSDAAALSKIGEALSSLLGKTIVVDTISPTSKNQECTVMCIYPDESILDKLVEAIISEEKDSMIAQIWNCSMKWNIEIDTRILASDADLNEKELTALILHECGHIIYSNSVPMRVAKIVRYEFAKTDFVNKQLLRDTFFSKLLYIPLINACAANRHKASMKTEMHADKYVMQSGYGKDLASAIDKIIIFAGTNVNPDSEMKELAGFSIDSLINLQKRKNNVVKKNMITLIAATPSKFAQSSLKKISIGISGNSNPLATINESVKDQYIANKIDSIVNNFHESDIFVEGIFNRVHKMKRIDPADLDYIGLEVNDIKSNDDKMMIVSYIHNKIDIVDYYIALIDSKNPQYVVPHTRESLVQMKELLEKYRMAAINRKLPDVNYGISIQWPTGYEG